VSTLSEVWNTTRMRLLVELDRHKTLSEAARSVGIGQPGASEHLRLLEIAAGEQLAVRGSGGVVLTETGRMLATHAARALECLRAGEDELSASRHLTTGTLRLGASPVPGVYILPAVVSQFSERYPGLKIDFRIGSTEQILELLNVGQISMAVLCANLQDKRLIADPFLEDEIVGVAKPGFLDGTEGEAIAVEALAGATLLLQEKGSSTRRTAMNLRPLDAVSWGGVLELGSTEAIKRGARAGLGVGFVSRHVLNDEVARGELSAFRIAGAPPISGQVSVVKPRIVPTGPVERAFLEVLADWIGRLYGGAKEQPRRLELAKPRK
jgi:DNA-binding transcriptional LysR family regulator